LLRGLGRRAWLVRFDSIGSNPIQSNPSLDHARRTNPDPAIVGNPTPEHALVGSHEGSHPGTVLEKVERGHGKHPEDALDGGNLVHVHLDKENLRVLARQGLDDGGNLSAGGAPFGKTIHYDQSVSCRLDCLVVVLLARAMNYSGLRVAPHDEIRWHNETKTTVP